MFEYGCLSVQVLTKNLVEIDHGKAIVGELVKQKQNENFFGRMFGQGLFAAEYQTPHGKPLFAFRMDLKTTTRISDRANNPRLYEY
jgi:hypothetical protein